MSDTANASTATTASAVAAGPVPRVITQDITIQLAGGKTLAGRLEHFQGSKALALFDDEGLATSLLTVPAIEAPVEHDALAPDEVLLRNWTELRGAAQSLADQGVVELTGREATIGMFRLQALVARVL